MRLSIFTVLDRERDGTFDNEEYRQSSKDLIPYSPGQDE